MARFKYKGPGAPMPKRKPIPVPPWRNPTPKGPEQGPEGPFTEVGDAPQLREFLPSLGKGHFFHSAWSSPEQLAKHIRSADRSQEWGDSGWDGTEAFTGTKTMEEALDMAENGWAEGIDKVFRLRADILAKNPIRMQPVKFGIAGATPDVPRAIAGNIFNMRIPDMSKSKRRPVITLVSNMTANCGVEKEMITNRAAVVAAIIDRIETAGYAVEVVSTAMAQSGKFKAATSVIVKEAGHAVDTGKLAYGLGHSSFFRRLVFASWSGDKRCQDIGYGLGIPFEPAQGELAEKNIFILPSSQYKRELFKTEELAGKEGLEMLVQRLANQKCPAFADIPFKQEEPEKARHPFFSPFD